MASRRRLVLATVLVSVTPWTPPVALRRHVVVRSLGPEMDVVATDDANDAVDAYVAEQREALLNKEEQPDEDGDGNKEEETKVTDVDAYFAAVEAAAMREDEALRVTEEVEAAESDDVLAPSFEDLRRLGMVADERLGEKKSHELVEVDDDGDPVTDRDRMVFVDEATCIGCTNCACIAPQTFTMDEEHGRARAVRQDGDTEETIEEAIATCPVDCIHWIPWDELVSLENQRANVMTGYNFKARLVGNEGFLSAQTGPAFLDISSNKAIRCTNCPTNKCPDCPMFSIGDDAARADLKNGNVRKRCGNCPTNGCVGCPVATQNPEFQKRRSRRLILCCEIKIFYPSLDFIFSFLVCVVVFQVGIIRFRRGNKNFIFF